MVKIFLFSCLKMHHFRAILPKWVLTPQKETSSRVFKMAIFSKFFLTFISHIIRYNAGKKIKSFSELFINNFFEYTFLSIFMHQSIASGSYMISFSIILSYNGKERKYFWLYTFTHMVVVCTLYILCKIRIHTPWNQKLARPQYLCSKFDHSGLKIILLALSNFLKFLKLSSEHI